MHSAVYKLSRNGKKIALKCIPFKKNNFIQIFRYVLKEFFFLLQGNKLGFGPKIYADRFNIIVYEKFIEF